MQMRAPLATVAAALAVVALFAACGDDDVTGPMFGDLEFRPLSPILMGSGRDTTLTLRNRGDSDLGPIVVGVDLIFLSTQPDSLCGPANQIVDIQPSSVSSLAPGGEVDISISLDLAVTTPQTCPPGQYDADMFAAVQSRILGGAALRFDWDGTLP